MSQTVRSSPGQPPQPGLGSTGFASAGFASAGFASTGPRSTVPAIELRGLTKSFGSVRAVQGIDLTVQPGEIIAFLGPNGAGKTTTIDMVLGLSRPDGGSVQVH